MVNLGFLMRHIVSVRNEIFDPNGLPKDHTNKYTDSLDQDDKEYLDSLKEKI
jgi:hypothetical protein